MTAEELAEVMKALDANRPHITQTMNFNAPIGQQISHVDKMEAHFDKDMGMQITNAGEVSKQGTQNVNPTADDAVTKCDAITAREELCHIIHPKLYGDDDKMIEAHNEIKGLVTNFGVQDICNHLRQMRMQERVLLPASVQAAYDELKRMGMPTDEKGYDYKTFAKYYNK